jgi:hypothetical protein
MWTDSSSTARRVHRCYNTPKDSWRNNNVTLFQLFHQQLFLSEIAAIPNAVTIAIGQIPQGIEAPSSLH